VTLNAGAGVGAPLSNTALSRFRSFDETGPDFARRANASNSDISAVAELGLSVALPVTDNITLSAGYDALWLSSVETAVGSCT
jgi:hypothetical protein